MRLHTAYKLHLNDMVTVSACVACGVHVPHSSYTLLLSGLQSQWSAAVEAHTPVLVEDYLDKLQTERHMADNIQIYRYSLVRVNIDWMSHHH